MSHYVLVLFRWSPETLFAIVTAVGIVFSVNGYDVPFETRSVCSVVLAVLALVDLAAAVCLHVLFELALLPEAALATLAFER